MYSTVRALCATDFARMTTSGARLTGTTQNLSHARKGESVWLAFPLHVLMQFAHRANAGDTSFAARCEHEATQLSMRIDNTRGGEWYRRAYFDDGHRWLEEQHRVRSFDIAKLVGVVGRTRRRAAARVERCTLACETDHALLQLLDPTFDKWISIPLQPRLRPRRRETWPSPRNLTARSSLRRGKPPRWNDAMINPASRGTQRAAIYKGNIVSRSRCVRFARHRRADGPLTGLQEVTGYRRVVV